MRLMREEAARIIMNKNISTLKIKIPKVKLTKHKGHDVVRVNAAKRVMYLCRTCQAWLGQKRNEIIDK